MRRPCRRPGGDGRGAPGQRAVRDAARRRTLPRLAEVATAAVGRRRATAPRATPDRERDDAAAPAGAAPPTASSAPRSRSPAARDVDCATASLPRTRHDGRRHGAGARRRCPPRSRSSRTSCGRIDETCSRFRDDSELALPQPLRGRRLRSQPAAPGGCRASRCTPPRARTATSIRPSAARSARSAGIATSRVVVARRGEAPRLRIVPAAGWKRVRIDRARRTISHSRGRRDRSRRDGEGARGRSLRARRARRRRRRAPSSTSAATSPWRAPAPASGWPILVTDDHRSCAPPPGQTIALAAGGLATSSTTVRRWRSGGGEVHHIVDPRSGAPAREVWRTVSVAAGDCVEANAASTAAIVRGEGASPGSSAPAARPASCAATARRHAPAAGPRRPRHERCSPRPVWYLMRGSGVVIAAAPDRRERARHRHREPLAPGTRPALRHARPAPQPLAARRRRSSPCTCSRRSIDPDAPCGLVAVVVPVPLRPLRRSGSASPRSRSTSSSRSSSRASLRRGSRRARLARGALARLPRPGRSPSCTAPAWAPTPARSWMLAVDARVHRALRRGRRAAAAERAVGRRQAPGAATCGRAVSALARARATRARDAPAAAPAGGRPTLAGGPPRALRPAAGVARRGARPPRRGRGERAARARRRRLPDARQAARRRGRARARSSSRTASRASPRATRTRC